MFSFHRKLSPLAAAILLTLSGGVVAIADDDIEFNPYFMSQDSQRRIDLSRYNRGLLPTGSYSVEFIVNGRHIGRDDITVRDREVDGKPVAQVDICVKLSTLTALDINIERLEPVARVKIDSYQDGDCLALNRLLPEGSVDFDVAEQIINLNLPEIYIIRRPRGHVGQEQWDTGIAAATLAYNFNASRTRIDSEDNDTLYGSVNSGVNLGGWYFRHNGIYTRTDDVGSRYSSLNTWLQRDIPAIRGRLLMGDANTKGELFDTLSFRGAQIANEEQMLPDSVRGYAPVVRGTARTAARVVIRQDRRMIYERTVPPGPFEITDLYPTGYGGHLEVTIEEADGEQQIFQIPYTSTSNLLRPGSQHYSLTWGKIRSGLLHSEPTLMEGTYQRGINNGLTLYSGLQGNDAYQALQGGGAVGTSIGAFSLDVTHARSRPGGGWGKMTGESYQLKYSHVVSDTGSNLSMAAWRFSTSGYLDFMTAMSLREHSTPQDGSSMYRRTKSRLMISASQPLPQGWGQLYVSAWQQSYRGAQRSDRQYQVGYNNHYKKLSYSLSINRNQDAFGRYQNSWMLNLTLPLDGLLGFNHIGSTITRGPGNTTNEQLFASGIGGSERQYNYSFTASHERQGGRNHQNSGSLVVNGSARTPYTTVSTLAGTGRNYNTWSAGINGSMVAHSGGLTLSPYNGDTWALVEAKGAKGARMVGYPGIKVDRAGYALIPYLTAYRLNEVEISPKGLSNNVELNLTSQKVAPYSGAVVKVKYDTTVGYPALINILTPDGRTLPFGAEAFDDDGRNIGMVGQGGRLFARVPATQGSITVIWGEAVDRQCRVRYLLPADADLQNDNVIKFNSRCEPVAQKKE